MRFVRRLAATLSAAGSMLCGVDGAAAQTGPSPAPPPSAEAENSGQDPTRPVTRFDLRLKYQDNPGGFESQILTLRADKPFKLAGGWKLNTRVDVPLVRTNTVPPENLAGNYKAGLGDLLVQVLFVTPPHGKAAFAIGTQMLMPTGTNDQFTSGKWRLVPTAAVVYQLPKISRGTFIGLFVRDDFSFAGKNNRAKINVFSVNPIFNWQLPQKWFVTFSPEAKFNTNDHWKLFLPFDMTVGRKIGPKTVMSLQGDVAIVDKYQQYDWQVEFRVGFFL